MDRKDYIKGKLANAVTIQCPKCRNVALTDGRIIVCSNCGVHLLVPVKDKDK